ncbi:MAG TPA: peptide chain release factor 1 [Ignavibacteriales bacterium]|nr:peptide chain release factor 1 [Ignavibacteriales bacterium]HOL82008.1 peptide chain release factor 1 [Ignavibacteriales bacterium]HRT98691.1 peptide chain release factor 1 [Ignavibacteriales bacterium]
MDLLQKLEGIKDKFDIINEQLSDPNVISDQDKYVKLTKSRNQLEPIVNAYYEYSKLKKHLSENLEIVDSNIDPELVQLAKEEIPFLKEQIEKMEEEIKILLLPKDPDDDKNAIVEIRAGTGGEEAALFVADLFRMYSRYAEKRGWGLEVLDINETGGLGGIKEVVFLLKGENVYGDMKFESGVHRVQRVPETEASGRVHTSAVTVAVLPEVDDVEVNIDQKDLIIDVYRAGGHGGQNVNKVETAIRITHIPTGIVVTCQDERSQLKNRMKAMKVLASKLYDMAQREQNKEISEQRKSMVGSGDRSEKIRTYNFPQNRITDHRIGLSLYNLTDAMDGEIDEIIQQLKLAERTEKLKEFVDNE